MNSAPKYRYSLNGLDITSEAQLPELVTAIENAGVPQVSIRFADFPGKLPDASQNRYGDYFSDDRFLMKIPGVANYLISSGNEILINPLPGSNDKKIRLFLLGSALGILFHQRGFLPLHASAVKVNGRGIAFVGESGAGKSTLAAFFEKKGYQVICDDVCALSFNKQGKPVIWPGVPRIKLWADTLEAIGQDGRDLVQDSYQENKYHLPLTTDIASPIELACIYELVSLDKGRENKINKLKGQEKMQALVRNIYRGELIETDAIKINIFRQCSEVAMAVDLYRYSRTRNILELDDGLRELEEHWRNESKYIDARGVSICA